VARTLVGSYPDGVWLVELAALTQPDQLAPAVRAALGLRQTPGYSVEDSLLNFLRSRRLLLVLDNCEHLLVGVASLVSRLVGDCPQLRVLATSREPLALAGEVVWRVPSLAVPPASCPPDRIGDYDAVRLFVDRAAAADRHFEPNRHNASSIAEICRRLDGMPLAIELAAARVTVLPPQQILDRLNDRFRFLRAAERSASPRHQTLRAAIDWSYDLLTPGEQQLFRRLAVFAGGFTLEAAEAICEGKADLAASASEIGAPPAPAQTVFRQESSLEVLDLVNALVNKSLVQVERSGGEVRYRLLETMRQYARERLDDAGEAAPLQARHRDWFLALAERGEVALRGPGQDEWLTRLEVESDNLRVALEWCDSAGETEAGLRLASALWWFWFILDRLTLGQSAVDRFLHRADTVAPRVRARALWRAGFLALWAEAHVRCEELSWEALSLCGEIGDDYGVAWVLDILGWLARRRGQVSAAREHFTLSVETFRAVGDRWAHASALADLGALAGNEGNYREAEAHLNEALAMRRALGDRRGTATTLRSLGYVAYQQEKYSVARRYYEQSLDLVRSSANLWVLSFCLVGLGDTLHQLGDYAEAERLLNEAVALARATGNRERGASALWSLGLLLRKVERLPEALACFRESLSLYLDVGAHNFQGVYNIIPAAFQSIAGILTVEGDPVTAVHLFGAADALNTAVSAGRYVERDPEHLRDVARNLEILRSILGDDRFDSAWAAGQALPLDQAVASALGE
jgi:non-specific serine/threonine protein kinase